MKSDLVTEGPPEVTEVNVLSESVILADPTFLRLGEGATFCRPGDYKVNQVYCPEARDSTNKPMPGQREIDPIQDTTPFGAGLGMESGFWHVRLIFDELLDPNVEDLIEVDGVTIGTIADTMPVTVTCNDADIAYDGFYDPSGNHLSYPPGPGLVVDAAEFVATGSTCSISINAGAVTDKDGVEVPSDQRGPYEFAIAALGVFSVAPADAEEGVDPAATVDIEFNAPIDVDTVAANVVLEDEGGTAVPFTVELAPADPLDPAAGTIPNIISLVPNAALDPATSYTVTVNSGIADVAGGELTLAEPVTVTFTTAAP